MTENSKLQYTHLICGDCIETMMELRPASVDMLFTDLPYGTTCCKWDIPIDLKDFWLAANRVVKPGGAKVLFAQPPFDKILAVSNLKNFRYEWIWEKTEATGFLNAKKMPLKAHENILVFYDKLPVYNPQMTHGHPRKVAAARHHRNCKETDVYRKYPLASSYDSTDRYPRDVICGPTDKQHSSLHPTQKPVWLCEKMVLSYTNAGQTVLDCCMGSGAIGVACQNTGRQYIGIDNDPHWVEIATTRLKENRQHDLKKDV